jgi:putative tricarboxylic transport membrane protein
MATFAMSEALTIILKRNDPTSAAKQVSLTELGSIKINKEERAKMYKTIPRSSGYWFFNWCLARCWGNNCFLF